MEAKYFQKYLAPATLILKMLGLRLYLYFRVVYKRNAAKEQPNGF